PVPRPLPPPIPVVAAPPPPRPAPVQPAPQMGGYMVQLGAYGDLNEARAAWQSAVKAHGDVLGGETPSYTSVTTASGKWIRLRIGPFASAGDAGQACDKIRTRKIDCLVAKS